MVIDTTSREGMESSLAHLMGVSVPELYQYIEAAADSAIEGQWCFNQALFDKAMEEENALPHGWENMPYEDFLIERRKLMAAKIKAAFEQLKKNVE